MNENQVNSVTQQMADGTETKALYIKHLSKLDWEIIEQLNAQMGGSKTVADIVRFALRRAAGRI